MQLPVLYLNLVGGQDELVFDGESFVMNAAGDVTQRLPACAEGLYPVDLDIGATLTPIPGACAARADNIASIYAVLVLGVRDYIHKNGFKARSLVCPAVSIPR